VGQPRNVEKFFWKICSYCEGLFDFPGFILLDLDFVTFFGNLRRDL